MAAFKVKFLVSTFQHKVADLQWVLLVPEKLLPAASSHWHSEIVSFVSVPGCDSDHLTLRRFHPFDYGTFYPFTQN